MSRLLVLGCASLTLFLVGCGPDLPETVPASGTVTLDGDPVEGATVNFMSEKSNITASGKTDASGEFSLTTVVGSEMVEGAVPGAHQVAVVKTKSEGPGTDEEDAKAMMENMAENPVMTSDYTETHLIPEKYSNPNQSGLRVQIPESGADDLTIELSSN